MALIPKDAYPDQVVDDDPAYPQGKARNVLIAGDNTGTPFEQAWLNDLWGFLQALLGGAGITPSGDPDKVGASQYLEALTELFDNAEEIAQLTGEFHTVEASGTLAWPVWATHADITLVGSGGGGGKGMSSGTGGDGGGGGGSGRLQRATIELAGLTSPLVITLAAPGAGSTSEASPGGTVGYSTVADDSGTLLVRALGGIGANGAAGGDGYSGGGGGGDSSGNGNGGAGGSLGTSGANGTGTSGGAGGEGIPTYLRGQGAAGGAGGSYAVGGSGGGGGGGGGGPMRGGPGATAGGNSGTGGTSVGGAGGQGYGAGGGGGAGGATGSPGAGANGGAGALGVAKIRFFRAG
jgi:hypothetical protein